MLANFLEIIKTTEFNTIKTLQFSYIKSQTCLKGVVIEFFLNNVFTENKDSGDPF